VIKDLFAAYVSTAAIIEDQFNYQCSLVIFAML